MFGHFLLTSGSSDKPTRKRKLGLSKSADAIKHPAELTLFSPALILLQDNLPTKIPKISSTKSGIPSTKSGASSVSISTSVSRTSCTSASSDAGLLIDLHSDNVYTRLPTMRDTLLVEDEQTHRKWFASSHSQPFYNFQNWHSVSQQVAIELAVCGGRIYQSLLGNHYPGYFIAKSAGDEDEDVQYYRICEKVEALAEGLPIFSVQQSFQGFFKALCVSFLLGDTDISNILLNQQYSIVRFDPELCFTQFFRGEYNKAQLITEELSFLYHFNAANAEQIKALHSDRKNLTIPEHMQQLIKISIPPFLTECFKHHIFNDPKVLEYLQNTSLRQREILEFLETLQNKEIEHFKIIIDKTISDAQIRDEVWNEFQQRCQHFKLAYQQLKQPEPKLGLFSKPALPNPPQEGSSTPTLTG